MQFARNEMHIVKEDIREMIKKDMQEYKDEIKSRNSRIMKIAITTVTLLIGFNVLAWFRVAGSLNEKVQEALIGEVNKIQQKIAIRLDTEFKTPRIQKLIEDKAKEFTEKEAKKYIEEKVDDAIKPVTTNLNQIEREAKKTNETINNTQSRIDKQFSILAKQTDVLMQRSKLTTFADKALEGDAESFRELLKYEGTDMETAALGEIARVKNLYLVAYRNTATTLTVIEPDGSKKVDAEIQTSRLMRILKTDSSWENRAKAAQLLGGRNQKGVPDALIEACNDKRLDVIRDALRSFSSLTGRRGDILECKYFDKWWVENKSEIDKKLKELDSK
jgi:hypothetical protein